MTTKSGARVYRGLATPLDPGACPHCGRVIPIVRGHRRSHYGTDRRPCSGGRVFVEGTTGPVLLDDLPDVVWPPETSAQVSPRLPAEPKPKAEPKPDPRRCVCGWRPRRKGDGTFEAHRIRPDDPAAPYCPNGATRSRC